MKSIIFLLCSSLLMAFFSSSVVADVDSCVDKKIQEFREYNGPDAPIMHGVLKEWESDCRNSGSDNNSRSALNANSIKLSSYTRTRQFAANAIPVTSLYLRVQSREDSVSIDEIIVNRGNCEVDKMFGDPFPINLNFGEQKDLHISTGCSILETSVQMNGEWFSYSWS